MSNVLYHAGVDGVGAVRQRNLALLLKKWISNLGLAEDCCNRR